MNDAKKDLSWEIYHDINSSRDIEKFIKKYGADTLSKHEWLMLVNSKVMTTDQIYKYRDYLDWEWLCITYKFSTQFLEKMKDYIHWGAVSYFQNLSLEFIKKYKNKLNLTKVKEHLEGGSKETNLIRNYIDRLSKDAKAKTEWEKIICPFFHCNKSSNDVVPKHTLSSQINELDKIEENKNIEKNTKTNEKPSKKEVKSSKPKKSKKIDYSALSKNELKSILEKRKVRVFYHDTIPILIKKCQESE